MHERLTGGVQIDGRMQCFAGSGGGHCPVIVALHESCFLVVASAGRLVASNHAGKGLVMVVAMTEHTDKFARCSRNHSAA